MRYDINNETHLLLFMHIPKTAGSTMRLIIERQYPEESLYRSYPGAFRRGINGTRDQHTKCILGHDYFGTHHDLEKKFYYVTMLRDPVDRVISEYFYICRYKDHDPYIHNKLKSDQLTLNDYINSEDPRFLARTMNMQTVYASGGSGDLTHAKENLETYFPIVGLVEYFDQSMLQMKEEFGWGNIVYRKRKVNANPKRVSKENLPLDFIRKIEERNELDIKLYEWAKKIFLKKITKEGKS